MKKINMNCCFFFILKHLMKIRVTKFGLKKPGLMGSLGQLVVCVGLSYEIRGLVKFWPGPAQNAQSPMDLDGPVCPIIFIIVFLRARFRL